MVLALGSWVSVRSFPAWCPLDLRYTMSFSNTTYLAAYCKKRPDLWPVLSKYLKGFLPHTQTHSPAQGKFHPTQSSVVEG